MFISLNRIFGFAPRFEMNVENLGVALHDVNSPQIAETEL